jgi:hypothetical protein
LVAGFRLLFASCRIVSIAPEARLKLNAPEAITDTEELILCAWHDALILPTFLSSAGLRRKTCCLVSRHQDGSYLADTMALLGYSTVRGSSNKGGAAAIRQLLDDTAGKHIVITPDGPRGPRRELKAGPVYLASQLGRRIVCGAYVCRSGWRIRGSWTDMLIPLPFTTIYALTSDPLTIPADLSRDALAAQIARVQAEMDRLDAAAEALVAGQPPAKAPAEHRRAA